MEINLREENDLQGGSWKEKVSLDNSFRGGGITKEEILSKERYS